LAANHRSLLNRSHPRCLDQGRRWVGAISTEFRIRA
jgi:hypothetical protein